MHKLNYLTGGRPLAGNGLSSAGEGSTSKPGTSTGAGTTGAADNATAPAKALILLHGRGGTAEDILSLADALPVKDFALFAPQAQGNSWYPLSFLAPIPQNEPWLDSALDVIKELVDVVKGNGIAEEHIWFAGFSQGACLMLEFLARNAQRYGGAAAFTGGLIGDRIYPHHYKGDFKHMPIFIGTSSPDPHVPVQRVHDTTAQLKGMNAKVTEIVYPGMGHTVTGEEIREARKVLFNVS